MGGFHFSLLLRSLHPRFLCFVNYLSFVFFFRLFVLKLDGEQRLSVGDEGSGEGQGTVAMMMMMMSSKSRGTGDGVYRFYSCLRYAKRVCRSV